MSASLFMPVTRLQLQADRLGRPHITWVGTIRRALPAGAPVVVETRQKK